jgi:hypothetical protein
MRNRIGSLVVFLFVVLAFSLPAGAQVFYPRDHSDAQKEAAAASKSKLTYDPHDLSGIWRSNPPEADRERVDALPDPLMGGTPAPPMTAWGQALFDARKPSQPIAPTSRRVPPALGNDPLGNCEPLGYPRSLGRGPFEFIQTPDKILQVFNGVGYGMGMREIYTDGRTLPSDLDPRWYGWAVGHWEGDTLVVNSTNYDERSWLGGNGHPHSEGMRLQERYRHPDAMTLEITMTLDDPKAYKQPWVGAKQTFKLELPKGLTVLYEEYCVPSEEERFNEGIRNPAGGLVSKNSSKQKK